MSGLRETFKLAVRSARHRKRSNSPAKSSGPNTQPPTSSHGNEGPARNSDPPDLAEETLSIPEQLWNSGYQNLKDSKPQLINSFEAILSKTLPKNGVITNQQTLQMLIKASLERTENSTKSKEKLKNVKFIIGTKSVISAGLQASQEASLAWAAACTILELLANISHEAVSNREGIEYVIKRLEFNNKLSILRLSDNDFAPEMRDRIVDLYTKILRYLVESVVYLQQHKITMVAKDSVKRYSWDSLLQEVKNAEKLVESDDAVVKKEKNTANLQVLTTIARTAEDNECLRQLRVTDPRDDKKRIEEEKGGLLKDAYTWILENKGYRSWLDQRQDTQNVLWIRGDPGKGKTMLSCGIINELKDQKLAFFFCQATDPRINSAESVLRGLLYMMADEDSTSRILSQLRDRFDRAGHTLFKDANTWIVVKELFENVLQDFGKELWLIIDALDECIDRYRLLDFIKASPKNVKWLISSRNWPDIEEALKVSSDICPLSLELNADSVSLAVQTFISIKTDELAIIKQLTIETADSVREYLSEHAQKTFLWVAVVVQSLQEKSNKWNILDLLKKFPTGLQAMYTRIAALVEEVEEAELLKEIISIAATVTRPLSLAEMINLLDGQIYSQDHLAHIIKQSGFLTAQSSMVAFVHYSAKVFILSRRNHTSIPETHRMLYTRSVQVLSKTLRRNICNMTKFDCHVDDLQKDAINPLTSIAYPCIHWLEHLEMLIRSHEYRSEDQEILQHFIKSKYVYWIEALIWLRAFSQGISRMIDLKLLLTGDDEPRIDVPHTEEFRTLIRDALRFIMFCSYIDKLPLQLYTSGLFFSPVTNLIRSLFSSEIPSWLTSEYSLIDSWSNCVMTYDLPAAFAFRSLALSSDGEKLAIVTSHYAQVRSARTGALELHLDSLKTDHPVAAAFTRNNQHLLLVEKYSGKVDVYDCSTGFRMRKIMMDSLGDEQEGRLGRMAYVSAGRFLVHSYGRRLNSRDYESGDLLYFLCFSGRIEELELSHDGSKLVVRIGMCIYLYTTSTGEMLWSVETEALLGSTDLKLLAFTHNDHGIIFNKGTDLCVVDIHTQSERHVIAQIVGIKSFHARDHHLVLQLRDGSVILTNLDGAKPRVIMDKGGFYSERYAILINSLWLILMRFEQLMFYDTGEVVDYGKVTLDKVFAVSPDHKRIAQGHVGGTIQIIEGGLEPQELCSDFQPESLFFSYDHRLAIYGKGRKIAIWDIAGVPKLLSSFIEFLDSEPYTEYEESLLVEFSPQGQYAIYGGIGTKLAIYDGQTRMKLDFDDYTVGYVKLAANHLLAASISRKDDYSSKSSIKVWNTKNGAHLIHSIGVIPPRIMAFSIDGGSLAYMTYDSSQRGLDLLEIRDTGSWNVIDKVECQGDWTNMWYSDSVKQFRTQEQLMHPKTSCEELFVRRNSVYIGDEFALRLPSEYGNRDFEIHGHSLVCKPSWFYKLSQRKFEVNVKKAIKDIQTMQKIKRSLP